MSLLKQFVKILPSSWMPMARQTITANEIDNGSSDACDIASLSLDITAFGCDETGSNTVTLDSH